MGFLLLGKNDSKKAAQEQAKATRDAAALASRDAMYAAEAAQQQQVAAGNQRIAQQKAQDLLDVPMESASVDLAAEDSGDVTDDLLTKRRSKRSAYQPSAAGIQTP